MRYFIYFSFNGKLYHGWQKQKNSITIQEKIEESLSVLLKDKIEVIGAGRTDAGVHAIEQSAHFDCKTKIIHLDKFLKSINDIYKDDMKKYLDLFYSNIKYEFVKDMQNKYRFLFLNF